MKVEVIQYEHRGIPQAPFVIQQGNEEALLDALIKTQHEECNFRLPVEDETAEQYHSAYSELWDIDDELSTEEYEELVKENMVDGKWPNDNEVVRWWSVDAQVR